MKRSANFRGSPGKYMTLAKLVDLMKAAGKSDEEIVKAVEDIERKLKPNT